jgi:hypothetical protein
MKLQESIQQAQGHLDKVDEQQFDTIDFEWEGIRFFAKSENRGDNGFIVSIKAVLGRLFLTVEDPHERAQAMERLYSTNKGIDGRYRITPLGQVEFQSITSTDGQLFGAELMSALTLILLEAESHLRALRSHLRPL